ncbi:hypothetical protein RhiirC2_786057 [Rhizophagus irregularis]|uniref:Uncharacterized protein n=1 Tax=Rhizophagus irregularis TaxID=588596 RepID=A0A2N1MV89_9GLOM|nr:hypothetical protein RhiirC2_786057 [Rhizophagus irregularis]
MLIVQSQCIRNREYDSYTTNEIDAQWIKNSYNRSLKQLIEKYIKNKCSPSKEANENQDPSIRLEKMKIKMEKIKIKKKLTKIRKTKKKIKIKIKKVLVLFPLNMVVSAVNSG